MKPGSTLARITGLALLALVGLGLGLASTAQAQVAPDAHWRTLTTEHFRVTYDAPLAALAPVAALDAERAWAALSSRFESPPAGRIDLVLSDGADYANGSSSPLPSNRVIVLTTPPTGDMELGFYRDWLQTVLDHELTHTFHLNRAGTVGRILRHIFGRVPVGWPFFPGLDSPRWVDEGIAVEFETRLSGAGRLDGSYHDMVMRTAILEHDFWPIDRATGDSPLWPAGDAAYAYGSRFIDALSDRFGRAVPSKIVDKTDGAVIPPALAFDRVGSHALGESFSTAWRQWRDTLTRRDTALADSLRASGLTHAETLTSAGRYAFYPRVSPDGRTLAYSASTGRGDPATWVLDLASGRAHALARRNGGGFDLSPASWLPHGNGLVTAQLHVRGTYRLYSDLSRIDRHGGEHRLTRGARLRQPDVAPDGRRVVAIQDTAGANRLVIYDLRTGRIRALTGVRPDTQWALPRWSPDGRRIAVSRWTRGGLYDLVVLDTTGAVRVSVTRDRALDRAPAWSPHGRWLLFDSDRSGISNIYAARMPDDGPGAAAGAAGAARGPVPAAATAPAIRQVTNVLTGAFQPDVSPDGRTLYFVGYRADGFHIERMPFDTAAWRPESPLASVFTAPPPDLATADSAARAATAGAHDGGYAVAPGVLPHFWIPLVSSSAVTGTGFGIASFGDDVVGRHQWLASATVAPSTGRLEGGLSYRWAGLGNPLVGLDLSQSWDHEGSARLQNGSLVDVSGRLDDIALSTTLLRSRWRSASALSLGVERIFGRRVLENAPGYRLDGSVASIGRWGAFATASVSTARAHSFSISRDAGASLVAGVRRRWDDHAGAPLAEQYTELFGVGTLYHAFRAFGFADHVLALRASGLDRTGATAPTSDLGGPPGQSLSLGFGIGALGGGEFLPVRGFAPGARRGTHAWSASVEYRLPIALVARGHHLWPLFLDHVSAAAFLDAGDAWCTADQQGTASCDPTRPDGAHPGHPLIGTGAELSLALAALYNLDFRLRTGIGFPLAGSTGRSPRVYVTVGPAF